MKQTIALVVLAFMLAGACFGIYHFWSESKDYKSLWDAAKDDKLKALDEKDKQYNTERKQLVDDLKVYIEKNRRLDKDLDIAAKKITELDILLARARQTGGGKGTGSGKTIEYIVQDVTSPAGTTAVALYEQYSFKDYHLDITFSTVSKEFQYELDQRFIIQSYHTDDDKLQVEMAEVDATGEVRQVFKLDITSLKEKEKGKLHTGFNLNVGAAGYIMFPPKGSYGVHALVNFLSHGKSHLDSNWRFLSVGVGYPGVVVAPVQYRISNHIPMLSDTFIEPIGIMDYKGKFGVGIGISSTL